MNAKYKVEVLVFGETTWSSNSKRFDTEDEAQAYGADLADRWFAVKEWRVVKVEDQEQS